MPTKKEIYPKKKPTDQLPKITKNAILRRIKKVKK